VTTFVGDLAESLLASSVAVLGGDAPTRRVVSWTDESVTAADCEQVMVSLGRLARSNLTAGRGSSVPSQPRAQPSLPVAVFRVRLDLVCWPTLTAEGNDPTAATVTAAAYEALTKAGTLWLGISEQATAGGLFADVADLGEGCPRAEVTQWTSTPPQGRTISSVFDVAATIVRLP